MIGVFIILSTLVNGKMCNGIGPVYLYCVIYTIKTAWSVFSDVQSGEAGEAVPGCQGKVNYSVNKKKV